jgi:toxin-antitoxin system PIN domain toxin
MLLPDVNILVYAQREDLPAHAGAKSWLESALNGGEPVGLFDPTLAAFLRIVTNRRIFRIPTPLPMALSFIEAVRAAPAAHPLKPGVKHWEIFARLCRNTNAAGDDIPDAYLAALAIENDCDFISTDGDFARFPGLKWRRPF